MIFSFILDISGYFLSENGSCGLRTRTEDSSFYYFDKQRDAFSAHRFHNLFVGYLLLDSSEEIMFQFYNRLNMITATFIVINEKRNSINVYNPFILSSCFS